MVLFPVPYCSCCTYGPSGSTQVGQNSSISRIVASRFKRGTKNDDFQTKKVPFKKFLSFFPSFLDFGNDPKVTVTKQFSHFPPCRYDMSPKLRFPDRQTGKPSVGPNSNGECGPRVTSASEERIKICRICNRSRITIGPSQERTTDADGKTDDVLEHLEHSHLRSGCSKVVPK